MSFILSALFLLSPPPILSSFNQSSFSPLTRPVYVLFSNNHQPTQRPHKCFVLPKELNVPLNVLEIRIRQTVVVCFRSLIAPLSITAIPIVIRQKLHSVALTPVKTP